MFVANQRGKYDSVPLALSRRRPDAVEMGGSGRKPDARTYEDLLDLFCCSSLDSIKYGFLFTQRGSDGDLLVPCLPTSSLASAFRRPALTWNPGGHVPSSITTALSIVIIIVNIITCTYISRAISMANPMPDVIPMDPNGDTLIHCGISPNA
jgi:hypothetical protein